MRIHRFGWHRKRQQNVGVSHTQHDKRKKNIMKNKLFYLGMFI